MDSDAEWFFRDDPETEHYHDIFFSLCRKFNIQWATATEKEKAFIEGVIALARALYCEPILLLEMV